MTKSMLKLFLHCQWDVHHLALLIRVASTQSPFRCYTEHYQTPVLPTDHGDIPISIVTEEGLTEIPCLLIPLINLFWKHFENVFNINELQCTLRLERQKTDPAL